MLVSSARKLRRIHNSKESPIHTQAQLHVCVCVRLHECFTFVMETRDACVYICCVSACDVNIFHIGKCECDDCICVHNDSHIYRSISLSLSIE